MTSRRLTTFDIDLPFTVLIDTAEQDAFTFVGIKARQPRLVRDGVVVRRNYIARTERECLGRYPDSLGDYTIKGERYRGRCHIERKSVSDFQGTLLGRKPGDGGSSRWDRFECELKNLAKIECPLVVVEGSYGEVLG